MAGEALLFQSHIGAGSFPDTGIGYEITFMAGFAVDFRMGSLQGIARKRMIKLICIKADHLEFHPVVVTVTRCAIFALHLGRGMVTPVPGDPCFYGLVTIETFLTGYLFPENMALGAV
jgi:hypothetical protein